jgi:hypothetical protein
VAGNADRDETIQDGISAHATSLNTTEHDAAWALLDEYARLVTLHQSDLLWTEEKGYRTPAFGELPFDDPSLTAPAAFGSEDPFGSSNPFGQDDPFGRPAEDEEPIPGSTETEANEAQTEPTTQNPEDDEVQ